MKAIFFFAIYLKSEFKFSLRSNSLLFILGERRSFVADRSTICDISTLIGVSLNFFDGVCFFGGVLFAGDGPFFNGACFFAGVFFDGVCFFDGVFFDGDGRFFDGVGFTGNRFFDVRFFDCKRFFDGARCFCFCWNLSTSGLGVSSKISGGITFMLSLGGRFGFTGAHSMSDE